MLQHFRSSTNNNRLWPISHLSRSSVCRTWAGNQQVQGLSRPSMENGLVAGEVREQFLELLRCPWARPPPPQTGSGVRPPCSRQLSITACLYVCIFKNCLKTVLCRSCACNKCIFTSIKQNIDKKDAEKQQTKILLYYLADYCVWS